MADILIRSIKMPDCCYHCFALDDNGDYPRCLITQEQRGYTFQTREKRMDKCPLIALPEPHGRLIEEKAALEAVRCGEAIPALVDVFSKILFDVPTIIPAEKEAET